MVNMTTSPRFAESKKATNLRMLSVIVRPSRIAATIVAKSSFVRTRSDGFPRRLRPGAPHGHADVRPPERRRVVDAVTRDGDDLAFRLTALDEPELLLRRDAGVHCFGRKAERSPDGQCGQAVVSREHLDAETGLVSGSDRGHGSLPRRIVQRDQAERHEVGFDLVVREQVFGAEVAFRDRDDTETVARPVRGLVLQARPLPSPSVDRLRIASGAPFA